MGRAVSIAGEEEERLSAGGAARPLDLEAEVWISPLAAASLFVNEEIAHPAQEAASVEGVPIRGVAPLVVGAPPAGGRAVSGRAEAYLRMRARMWPCVFGAGSRPILKII